MADRQKLQRLEDDIIKAGCTAYLWYQDRTRPKEYGPHLTYREYKELKKWPIRKKWDAFYYRHMAWIYRKHDESMVQYFKRGYPAWLFLGHRSFQQPTPPKRILILPVLFLFYVIAFPFFTSSAVPGWEYTSPILQLVGDDNFNLVVNLYVLSGMIVFVIAAGLMMPLVMRQYREELRAGKTAWQVFGPPPWFMRFLKIPFYPFILVYRYARRFTVKPTVEIVADELQELEAPQSRFAFLRNAYRSRIRRNRP